MEEGYVFLADDERPMEHVRASLATLRRYDPHRPAVLLCPPTAAASPEAAPFARVEPMEAEALAGFRFALDRFARFERTLVVTEPLLWCRDPAPLWQMLAPYAVTATGYEKAAPSFEQADSLLGIWRALRDRRREALRMLGLTHLPRVAAALVYVQDRALAREVGYDARCFAARVPEWTDDDALAAALSRRQMPVLEARHGHLSPLLDYVDGLVHHDDAFEQVTVRYFVDPFIASLRTLQAPQRREHAFRLLGGLVGRGDHLDVTPFALRFAAPDARRRWAAFSNR